MKAVEFEIKSQGKTYTAYVDYQDYKRIYPYKWHLTQNKKYVIAWVRGKRVRLHHFIIGKPPKGKEVDHISRNGLDNTRENLRFVTSSVNQHNKNPVGVRKHGNRWEANICVNYQKYFESFPTKHEALVWREYMKDNYLKSL